MHGGFRYRGGGTCNEMQYLIASCTYHNASSDHGEQRAQLLAAPDLNPKSSYEQALVPGTQEAPAEAGREAVNRKESAPRNIAF